MVRQNYNVNTTEKKLEVFTSLGGGMVTQSHPEKLKDDQFKLLENVDIVEGGAVENRGAYSRTHTAPQSIPTMYLKEFHEFKDNYVDFEDLDGVNFGSLKDPGYAFNPKTATGMTQGRFRYYKKDGYEDFVAVGGFMFKVEGDTYHYIRIEGMKTGFQTTRIIEGAQYQDNMYFATGSGLVKYDGNAFTLVKPYEPNGLEALYIGTNGLADNPDQYLTDNIGESNTIYGVIPSTRYGIINKPVTFTTYCETIAGQNVEYKFELKRLDEPVTSYEVKQDWSSEKFVSITFNSASDYMLRISLRKKKAEDATTDPPVLSSYILPKYTVKNAPDDKADVKVKGSNLKNCNRILFHYDRMLLFGDTENRDVLYISQLENFTYFPVPFTMSMADPLRGFLRNVVRFRNFLVCFTDGSIQMISGTNPQSFSLSPVHTTLGTKHDYSVQVMENYVVFVGSDNGIYILKQFQFASNDKMNVERMDTPIRDVVVNTLRTSTKVLSTIYNNQYYLYIENGDDKLIYRFYYNMQIWVRDRIGFSLGTMANIDDSLTVTSDQNGNIYELKKDVYRDDIDSLYSMTIISKDFNMGTPHHRKKMKQFQVLVNIGKKTNISTWLYADNTELTNQLLDNDPLQDSDAQKLKITVSGRFRYAKVKMIIPVKEFIQITGFGFVFKENTPK